MYNKIIIRCGLLQRILEVLNCQGTAVNPKNENLLAFYNLGSQL